MTSLSQHPDVVELTHLYPCAGDPDVWARAVAAVARYPYMDMGFLWLQALPIPSDADWVDPYEEPPPAGPDAPF